MSERSYSREVYPNAPLKLVACELRFQLAPGADIAAAAQPFYDATEDEYPLQGPAPEQTIRIDNGVPSISTGGFRYLSRDKTRSIVVTSSAMIIESSAYTQFEDYADTIGRAVDALARTLKIASVERIGLRYIDEFTIAELPQRALEGYFNAAMLAAGSAIDGLGEPAEFMVSTSWPLGEDRHAVMRSGRVNQPTVATDGPLRIPRPSTGPLFVIDVDCSWSASTTTPLRFDREAITGVLTDLHVPVRTLFEHTITDQLRDDVLRKETPAS